MQEQRRLCDMILDASVRLGEMTKGIHKAPQDRKSQQYQNDTAVGLIQSKADTVKSLGFSPKQVQRFETLADNKDLVEQEKAQDGTAGASRNSTPPQLSDHCKGDLPNRYPTTSGPRRCSSSPEVGTGRFRLLGG